VYNPYLLRGGFQAAAQLRRARDPALAGCYNVSNMKTIAITIEDDVLNRIDTLADNRSEFIRKAVHDYLAHIEKLDEEQRERKIFRQNRERLRQEAIALIKEQAKP